MIHNATRKPPVVKVDLTLRCARYVVDSRGALNVIARYGNLVVAGYSREANPSAFVHDCIRELERAVAFALGAGR